MDKQARKTAEIRGRRAENLAALWLKIKGYKILGKRVKTPFGEIDIIARKGGILAITEVKARKNLQDAIAALHNADLSRIEEAAYYYQARQPKLAHLDIRFDAVFVGRGPRLKHEKNAWRGF